MRLFYLYSATVTCLTYQVNLGLINENFSSFKRIVGHFLCVLLMYYFIRNSLNNFTFLLPLAPPVLYCSYYTNDNPGPALIAFKSITGNLAYLKTKLSELPASVKLELANSRLQHLAYLESCFMDFNSEMNHRKFSESNTPGRELQRIADENLHYGKSAAVLQNVIEYIEKKNANIKISVENKKCYDRYCKYMK